MGFFLCAVHQPYLAPASASGNRQKSPNIRMGGKVIVSQWSQRIQGRNRMLKPTEGFLRGRTSTYKLFQIYLALSLCLRLGTLVPLERARLANLLQASDVRSALRYSFLPRNTNSTNSKVILFYISPHTWLTFKIEYISTRGFSL